MGIEATNSARESKVEKRKAKIEAKAAEQKKQAQAEQQAKELINLIAGESKAETVKTVKKDVKNELETRLKDGTISKDAYEEAKDYLGSKEFKERKKSDFQSEARITVAGLAGNSDGESIRGIKKDVKSGLKEKLENKEITKEEYDNAKSYTKTGSWIGRFFGVKEKESRKMFKTDAHVNEKEAVQQNGPKFSVKQEAMIKAAGFTTEDLYKIYDDNGGKADAEINYSWKKKQPGEKDAVLAALNANKNGIEFDKKDVSALGKALGYKVEKKISAGQTIEDMARGALIGSPASYIKLTQTQPLIGGIINVTQDQMFKAVGIGPAVGAAIGGVSSMITQAHRVEDRAIPTDVPENVKTYNDYTKYLDSYSTEKGAGVGKDIAKFFKDENGNLDVAQMNKILKQAAGTVGSTSTPLNYQEALGILSDLSSGKIKVEKPKKEEIVPQTEPEKCDINVDKKIKTVLQELPTECHKVKSGDNWYAVVMGKYQPKNAQDAKALVRYLKDAAFEAMKKDGTLPNGVTSSKAAFFPKVGKDLCVPSEITINGTKYTYNKNGIVKSGALGGKTSIYKAASNPFTTSVNKDVYNVNACGKPVVQDAARKEAEDAIANLKKQNPNVEYSVSGL